MIDLRPLNRSHARGARALLSGTALCSVKATPTRRQIIVKGPVTSIRIQKQPPPPFPIAKPQGARWVMTINPQTVVQPEHTVTAQPLINDQPNDSTPTKRQTKLATLITMLRREGGATIEEMAEATEWQVHSIRGALSGILKKKLELTITSEKIEGRGRVYRAS